MYVCICTYISRSKADNFDAIEYLRVRSVRRIGIVSLLFVDANRSNDGLAVLYFRRNRWQAAPTVGYTFCRAHASSIINEAAFVWREVRRIKLVPAVRLKTNFYLSIAALFSLRTYIIPFWPSVCKMKIRCDQVGKTIYSIWHVFL